MSDKRGYCNDWDEWDYWNHRNKFSAKGDSKGKNGNDTLVGGQGNDYLDGKNGNDVIFGNGGNDRLDGGEGNDTIYGGTGNDELHGGSGNDLLVAEDGFDELDGDSGNDTLQGGSSTDFLNGGSHDDRLIGGGGNDYIDGDSGTDTAVFSGSISDYRFFGDHGCRLDDWLIVRDTRAGSPDGTDLLHDVEVLQFSDGVIYLDGRNNAPIAADDAATVLEDKSVTVSLRSLLANDDDFDGDRLSVVSVSGAVHGTVTLDGNGNAIFTPDADFNGAASFTYKVSDGHGGFDEATVRVDVKPVNDGPVARADSYATGEDDVLTVSAPGVLANDTDVDGDVLSVANGGTHTTGLGATVVLNANGSFSYDAASSTVLQALNDGDSRVDSFTYIASDGHGGTSTQTVTVTVAGVTDGNHAPVAADDAFGGDEDTTISGNVLGNDSDPDAGDTLTVTSVGTFATAHGSVTIAANGDFTYFPAENFFGEDAFDYTIADADGAQSTASVALTVNPVNDLPVAVEDNVTVTEDSPGFSGNVLTNDQSEDTGESLSVLNPGVYETDLGVFDLQIDGSYTYTLKDAAQALAEGGVAVENRLYVIGDGAGNLTSNFLTVTITGVNDAPDAHDDVYAGDQGIGLDIATDSLLANDTDVDTAFSIDSVQDAVNGTVSLSGGVVTFIPDAGFFGDAGFTYTVRDTAGATDTAAVSVHVRSSSDVLHAESDGVFVLNEDDELLIPAADLLVNDTGAGITVDSVGNATHGFVQLAGDLGDQVEFIPDYGFSGQATFDYTITDASGELSTATVTLDYRPVADTPVVFANDVAGVTGENISLLLEANLDDQDGSETLTVLLSNVLPGATFSSDDAGAVHVGTDLTGGLWLFASGDLSTLHVAGLAAGDNVMTLIGIAAENGTDPQLTALASATFHVNVALPDPDGGIPL